MVISVCLVLFSAIAESQKNKQLSDSVNTAFVVKAAVKKDSLYFFAQLIVYAQLYIRVDKRIGIKFHSNFSL